MDYSSFEQRDPYKMDNVFMTTRDIPDFSRKAQIFFAIELVVIIVSWASVISGKAFVMIIAVPLIFLNLAICCLMRIVTERHAPNFR